MRLRTRAAALFAAIAIGWCWYALAALDRARAEERAAQAAGAAPRIVAARPIAAADEARARATLARLLGDGAAAAGVRLALAPADGRVATGLVAVRLEADGAEPALRRFAGAVENGAGPMVRLIGWAMGGGQAGGAHLAANAIAAWAPSDATAAPVLRLPDAGAEIVPETRALFAAATAPVDAGSAGDLPTLVGIAGRLPDDAVALLRLADGSTKSVNVGGSAGGWRLATIAADRVQLTRGAEERVLVLPPQPEAGQ